MKKLATALFVLFTFSLSAQTIFYYGEDSVSSADFLRAWQKNNNGEKSEKAFRDYLDLFINSKLKVKEAVARGYDTMPQMVSDLSSLRQQILPSFLNDRDGAEKLAQEAFERAQKDIHLAHIFIGPAARSVHGFNHAEYKAKADAAMAELKSGKDFAEVARTYSADPSAKTNGGDIGWLTVFSLPYELENLAYSTAPGKTSGIYQSKAGFHIFKNLEERKSKGRMKAAQILLAFPPDADAATKEIIRKRADSIYERLMKGDDFAPLASAFSNDVISAAANGQMQEFGVGQYELLFENAAFALPKDGAISKPFLTDHGYHIVKRISRSLMPSSPGEKIMEDLRNKVELSDRMEIVRKENIRKQMKHLKIQEPGVSMQELWSFSDSVLNNATPTRPLSIKNETVVLRIEDQGITAFDWINYARSFRYKTDGTGMKTYPQLFEEFVEAQAVDYYQNHLENYNEDFARQLNEFKEGNLFFEIMQKEVWGPAQTDTAAIEKYFNEHRSAYNWKESADAVVFYAADAASAKTFRDQLVKNPANWNVLAGQFGEKIAADSSRFEMAQLPNPSKKPLKPGTVTPLVVNKMDQSTSFAYIIRRYDRPEPRSLADAKGIVINDYQNALEKKWITALKQKYPVRINQQEIDELVRSKKF